MDNFFVLILTGFVIGALGTLIGAGGGFILVPLLIFVHPEFSPETIAAVSIFIVACNALSGSVAYARSGRIDFKAGILFAACTIPGSILGVLTTRYIPKQAFNIIFGILLLLVAVFLFFKKNKSVTGKMAIQKDQKNYTHHELIDKNGTAYHYAYNQRTGILISLIVGYLSPILGIGGGIIHVPALVQWLQFPVYVATATSHFILAVMSLVSVAVHAMRGTYSSPVILHMIAGLSIGVIAGAQLGAFLSHRIKGNIIIRSLAICLGIVGLRILMTSV